MDTKHETALVISRHRTVPIPSTVESVPNYPSKLVIFRIDASPFYWARFYDSGRIFKRTTKTDKKNEAFKAAIAFYEELLVRKTGGLVIGKNSRFEVCAKEMLKLQESRIKRGERSASINVNEQSRLRVHMLPYFRTYDVGQIDYTVIETYLNTLTEKGLKVATLKLHESLLRKVLKHAHRKQIIPHLPAFPTITMEDDPRGYFNSWEYTKLHNKAKALVGTEIVVRNAQGKAERRMRFTQELHNLILFMVNTYVRPSDIKVLKHSHVAVVRKDNTYLRLSPPTTKKHNKPFISMPIAVEVYERQREYQAERKLAKDDDYVFMPEHRNRDYAYVQLVRLFYHLLEVTDLRLDAKSTVRTLYSLRHTAIMFRITKGDNIDWNTLAQNARTSAEMITRFYGSHYQNEMNVAKLQSMKPTKKRQKA